METEVLDPIVSKGRMYSLLQSGQLGNTNPTYPSLEQWRKRPFPSESAKWGVRFRKSGDPRMRLDIPEPEVEDYVLRSGEQDVTSISSMVDQWLVWRGHIVDSDTGIVTWGGFGRPELKWRQFLSGHAVETQGVSALCLLKGILNDNSFDDIQLLLQQYPGHAIEMTTMDRCYGTVPGRNAVIWEVRSILDGKYESWWRPGPSI